MLTSTPSAAIGVRKERKYINLSMAKDNNNAGKSNEHRGGNTNKAEPFFLLGGYEVYGFLLENTHYTL